MLPHLVKTFFFKHMAWLTFKYYSSNTIKSILINIAPQKALSEFRISQTSCHPMDT